MEPCVGSLGINDDTAFSLCRPGFEPRGQRRECFAGDDALRSILQTPAPQILPLKKIHNEPRPLDLDLISFGNETRASKELTLPHPRAHQRRFVLSPLAEIAPEWIMPGQAKTVAQLLAASRPDSGVSKMAA